MAQQAGYYMQPTIHGDTIVFVCEDDLWTVSAEGGVARRLTTDRGPVAFPRLSPDGKHLAYAARDEGPAEVYVMDAEGGPSERVTHLGGMLTAPVGWTPDGKKVVARSNAGQAFLGITLLYEIKPGGHPKTLPVGPARYIDWQPDGKGVVLGINTGDPGRWKRYKGGTAGQIWIDRKGDGKFKPLIRPDGNLGNPMWIGKRIYFVSDHEGHGNLYSCTPTGRGLTRHTDHEDYFARFPSSDGKRIVYHAGADLYVFDPATDETRKVDVRMQSARTGCKQRYVQAARFLESADLHPEGRGIALTVRGGAYTMPLFEGAPLRHGDVSSERRRLTRWLPDGKRVVMLGDASGEEALVVAKADGSGRPKVIKGDFGRTLDMVVAPKGDRVALTSQRQDVRVVDLKTGKDVEVERSPHHRTGGMSWSPDGRWLAYSFFTSRSSASIRLYDTQRKKVHEITRPDFIDFSPSFDPDGKYLCFLSHRVYDPVYDNQYFDLGFPRGVQPCLVTLTADTPSPFSAATRTPQGPAGVKTPPPKDKKDAKDNDGAVRIDLAGIQDRIVAFPVGEQRYSRIEAGKGRVFFSHHPVEGFLNVHWSAQGAPPAKQVLQVHTFADQKTETWMNGITGFALSSDRRSILVRVGYRLRALSTMLGPKEIPAKGDAGRESGWLDVERLRVQVDPTAEWGQMFDEMWRLQRDQFWEPGMSQVDWQDVHDRYRPLVKRVATRSEFSDLAWELQGELGTSHSYEMGGDYAPTPGWHQGQLGADITWSARKKRWVVKRIPRGDSWVRTSSSPLAAPGLGIREGDELLAVDGRKVGAKVSPAMCLVNQSGKAVRLTVARDGKKKRDVVVQTLGSEQMLRYRDWVEANRERVHKATRGKVGYVHVPNMGPWGFSEFHRYYQQEVDRPGLIVDVRYNGGGHVSQLLLQKLRRKRIGYGPSRHMGTDSYPDAAPMGPMVCITNEFAGSDGDIFSHSWKLYGLGPLVGKRTWGGVVGIWPRHALVDGTIPTQPEFAHWFEDVGYGVENYGTDPDIEVDIKPQDWKAGKDPQMERALTEIEKLIKTMKPKVPSMKPLPNLKPPRLGKRK